MTLKRSKKILSDLAKFRHYLGQPETLFGWTFFSRLQENDDKGKLWNF